MKTPHRKRRRRREQSNNDLSPDEIAQFEKLFRAKLGRKSAEWEEAMRLRRFVDACEAVFQSKEWKRASDGFEQRWLAWARAHADRRDPLKHGYLHAEVMRDLIMRAKSKDVGAVRKRILELLNEIESCE